MDFLNRLEDNSILIVPNNIKKKILEYINNHNILLNIKLMSFKDLKKGLIFDYTNETIWHLMKIYNLKYNLALNYIQNLYYLNDNSIHHEKYTFLKNLKSDLDNHNLLKYDLLFPSLLKNRHKLYVGGFSYLPKFNKYLLDLAKIYINIEIIPLEEKNHSHDVYVAKTMKEEIIFVAEQIATLISNEVPINKIFIANYTDDYYFLMNVIFEYYNIPFKLKNETNLYYTSMGKFILDHLDKNIELLLYKLRQKFNVNSNTYNNRIYIKIVDLLNKYFWTEDIRDVKDLLEEEMKSIRISNVDYKDSIKATSMLDNMFSDDEYVFMIGFNSGIFPRLKKDEDYLSDFIKPFFLDTTNEYNKKIKEATIKAFKQTKNLVITYKRQDAFSSYTGNPLINDSSLIEKEISSNISAFSNKINELLLTEKLDDYLKFNEQSQELYDLFNSYKLPYRSFNNSYKGIDSELIQGIINSNLSFSYSNISTFYECPFKFFIRNVLKIRSFEPSLDQYIGSLMHYVLERTLDDKTKNVDDVLKEYLDSFNYPFSYKNLFFIEKIQEEIKEVLTIIKQQYEYSSHDQELLEQNIEIPLNKVINTSLKGFIDKILLKDNTALIIDYKTNMKEIDEDLFVFGLNIQLLIYLYLVKKTNPNIKIAGIYLQHILIPKKRGVSTDDLTKEKDMRLVGLTINDIESIKKFDSSYENSKLIKRLKIDPKTNEIKQGKMIIDHQQENELFTLTENLINNCIDSVLDAQFDIKPIKIPKKVDGCEYCEYKDICFRKTKDYNYQNIIKPKGDEINE